MFAPVVGWLQAAYTAVAAALPDATVTLGPLLSDPPGDVVLVGHDDDQGREGTGWGFEGGWHDTGTGALNSGDATVYVTCWSRSGGDLTMADRMTAATTLHNAVMAALIPSPAGSSLGVSGVLWAELAAVRAQLLPVTGGNQVRTVLSIRLRCLS